VKSAERIFRDCSLVTGVCTGEQYFYRTSSVVCSDGNFYCIRSNNTGVCLLMDNGAYI
jgi:hypothetical protein